MKRIELCACCAATRAQGQPCTQKCRGEYDASPPLPNGARWLCPGCGATYSHAPTRCLRCGTSYFTPVATILQPVVA